jgi:kinesin family protein 1
VRRNTEPPQNGACFAEATEAEPPRLIAEVRQIPRRYVSRLVYRMIDTF